MSKKQEKDIISTEMTLDRFEGDNAVLISDEKKCVVPVSLLPRDTKEGEVVVVTFATDSAERNRKESKAKDILNEILHI
ncbi:MAG: DUF3006 domain-containing protein [Patescibacteria group bacterium]